MNEIPANLLYSPNELEKWLDDTSVPLSDDEMKAMSAYFDSEHFQFPDDSFRFYYCKLNGKSSVIEPEADKIYQIDNVGNFKVGCIYYSFDSLLYKAFLETRNDKYFYANRYLTYVWKNNKNDYSRIQRELSDELGYRAIRDFK